LYSFTKEAVLIDSLFFLSGLSHACKKPELWGSSVTQC